MTKVSGISFMHFLVAKGLVMVPNLHLQKTRVKSHDFPGSYKLSSEIGRISGYISRWNHWIRTTYEHVLHPQTSEIAVVSVNVIQKHSTEDPCTITKDYRTFEEK